MDQPTNPIIGKWKQPEGQPNAGLWYEFHADGTFQEVFSEMGVKSSGTFIVSEDYIYLNQTQHSLGLVGKFIGRFKIDSTSLLMSLVNAGERKQVDSSKHKLYLKQ